MSSRTESTYLEDGTVEGVYFTLIGFSASPFGIEPNRSRKV
jgi:hypothetical protein